MRPLVQDLATGDLFCLSYEASRCALSPGVKIANYLLRLDPSTGYVAAAPAITLSEPIPISEVLPLNGPDYTGMSLLASGRGRALVINFDVPNYVYEINLSSGLVTPRLRDESSYSALNPKSELPESYIGLIYGVWEELDAGGNTAVLLVKKDPLSFSGSLLVEYDFATDSIISSSEFVPLPGLNR